MTLPARPAGVTRFTGGSGGAGRWQTGRVRDAFSLDPATTHLNHGSFGAVPRVVAQAQARFRDRAEANPQRFFRVESPGLREHARGVAADFLGVGPDELGLVRNVSQAVATVLSSLAGQGRLGPGDVVVCHGQSYGSVRRAVAHWCERTGASYDVAAVPVGATDDEVVAGYADAFARVRARGDAVRLVVVDQVTSATGSVLPVSRVAAAARAAGALVLVDAAHVPGQLPACPAASGADFWAGTWHKWGFAPRGTSVLWVAGPERAGITPLTTSWNHGAPFPLPFDMHGTDDYSAWYALEAAVAFWREAGGLGIGARGSRLLDDAAPAVAEAVAASGLRRTEVALPPATAPCLRLVPLPDGVAAGEHAADALYRALSAERVETQVVAHGGRGWLRLSAAVYNEPADYERLAQVLPGALSSAAPAAVAVRRFNGAR